MKDFFQKLWGRISSNLSVVFITIFLDLLGFGLIIPILPILFLKPDNPFYLLSAGTSQYQEIIFYGLLIGVFPLAQFFTTSIFGELSDKFGRRKILIMSLIGSFFSYLLLAFGIFSKSLVLIFLARILGGFTGGNIAVGQAIVADISDEKTSAQNFGLIGGAFGLGFILGPFVGGQLAHFYGAVTPFWIVAFLNFLNIIFCYFTLKETLKLPIEPNSKDGYLLAEISNYQKTPRHLRCHPSGGELMLQPDLGVQDSEEKYYITNSESKITQSLISLKQNLATLDWSKSISDIRDGLQNKNLQFILLTSFLYQAGFTFLTTFANPYFIQKFNWDETSIGNFFALIGVWLVITQAFIIKYTTRFEQMKLLFWALAGTSLFASFLLIPDREFWLFIVAPFFAICVGLANANITSVVSKLGDEHKHGTALGINSSVQALAQALPPIISGFITFGGSTALPIWLSVIILGASSVVIFKKL